MSTFRLFKAKHSRCFVAGGCSSLTKGKNSFIARYIMFGFQCDPLYNYPYDPRDQRDPIQWYFAKIPFNCVFPLWHNQNEYSDSADLRQGDTVRIRSVHIRMTFKINEDVSVQRNICGKNFHEDPISFSRDISQIVAKCPISQCWRILYEKFLDLHHLMSSF